MYVIHLWSLFTRSACVFPPKEPHRNRAFPRKSPAETWRVCVYVRTDGSCQRWQVVRVCFRHLGSQFAAVSEMMVIVPATVICFRVLQCYAVCCSVMQCVAVPCNVLQRVAVCCSAFEFDSTFRNDCDCCRNCVLLQCVAV